MIIEIRINGQSVSSIHLPKFTERAWRNRVRYVQDILLQTITEAIEKSPSRMYVIYKKDENGKLWGIRGPTGKLDSLLEHEGSSAEAIYDADTCEKLFKWKSSKKEWRKIMSMDQPTKCGLCGKYEVRWDERRFAFTCTSCGKIDRKRTKAHDKQREKEDGAQDFQ